MRLSISISAVLFSILIGSSEFACATNEFIADKERGWFWYEDPIIEEEEELPPLPPPLPAAPVEATKTEEKPKTEELFSVKWLREQLPVLRDRAIDNPTKKNVTTYLYAQRVMFDKADNFTSTWKRVVMTDQLLDENNRFPFATGFRAVSLRGRGASEDKVLKHVSEKAGLFYFFKSSCSYCHFQLNALRTIAKGYGFIVKAVSLDGVFGPSRRKSALRIS